MAKFKIGDKVRISEESAYYDQCLDDLGNPTTGTITEILGNDLHFALDGYSSDGVDGYNIKWENGCSNFYPEPRLYLCPKYNTKLGALL